MECEGPPRGAGAQGPEVLDFAVGWGPVVTLDSHPGLVVLPGWLSREQQQTLVYQSLVEWAPVSTAQETRISEGEMYPYKRNLGDSRESLRWITMGELRCWSCIPECFLARG